MYGILSKGGFNLTFADIFTLCASVGFRNNRKSSCDAKGREMKSQNFKGSGQKETLIMLVLNDGELGKEITRFSDPEFQRKAKETLQEYAEGGMDIIVEKVFFGDNTTVSPNKEKVKDYYLDIMKFVLSEYEVVGFKYLI